jgi:predicted transposase YbfD/YdcC
MPELPGCVMTFDALHTVKETIETVVINKLADVLICVKDNASALRCRVEKHLNRHRKTLQRAETVDHAHGRIEWRSVEMAPISPAKTGWPHTHTACRVTRERQLIRRGETVETSREQVVYIGSFSADTRSPEEVLKLVRGHWGIENRLHHRKDRSMDEDRNRASANKTGRVMCCLRSIAALILGRAKESLSVVQRRLSRKTHLLVGLFSCRSLDEWERKYKPYKTA